MPRGAWIIVLLFLVLRAEAAQLQQGTIQGTVIGPDGEPVDDTVVTLLDGLGNPLTSVTTHAGQFRLTNVAPGTYSLRAEAPPLRAIVQTLSVGGALPVQIELRMSAVLAEQVVVHADQTGSDSPAIRMTIAGDAIRRTPARLRSRGLQGAIATIPGWATEDNGLLHVRGVDDGFLFVMDGVPVYERLDGLFGIAPDPSMIDSISVLTGYVPPEFGFKSGGVIEVRSAAHTADNWVGTLDVGGGSDETVNLSGMAGGSLGRSTALTLGITRETSSRFLDPVHPDNLHNQGGIVSGGLQFGWQRPASDMLTVVIGGGRSDFDVPHGVDQEAAGQDQRQQLRSAWETASWQHSGSTQTVSHVGGYYRFGSSALVGSPDDSPRFTDARRRLRRAGVLASITQHRGPHVIKIGGEASWLHLREDFRFAVTTHDDMDEADGSDVAARYTPERPFVFQGTAQPTLFSVYIQDSIRIGNGLTVDLGVRADWSRMLASASQVSPRIGASYRWPTTGTILRGSFGRFFQPPQPENLLLASSEAARELSPFAEETGGGADLLPEQQTAMDMGVSQSFGATVRLDVSHWRRRVHNAADPNVFAGTTIIVPNTVARGRASGIDIRLDVPRRAGWSGYLNYTNSSVVQFGPITGGLFLEDDVIEIGHGTPFTPDHDQRHVGGLGVSYDHDRGTSIAISGRYESGTPLEVAEDALDELAARPGAERVDFDRGRVRPRNVFDVTLAQRLLRGRRVDLDFRLSVLNLTGKKWAYNFGNPFSGTHFGHGRTVAVGLRTDFH